MYRKIGRVLPLKILSVVTIVTFLVLVVFTEAQNSISYVRLSEGIVEDLDQNFGEWDVPHCELNGQKVDCTEIEYGEPALESIITPSGDSSALLLAIEGGGNYPNVNYRRELNDFPNAAQANAFELDMYFLYRPETSFNNQGEPSKVQAIEFVFTVWRDEVDEIFRIYDWEIQFTNVRGDSTLEPIWRLWNPEQGDWVKTGDMAVPTHISAEEWHHFVLRGEILSDEQNFQGGYATHYLSFSIDNVVYPIDFLLQPVTKEWQAQEVMTVNAQLDGSKTIDQIGGYEVLLDNVNLKFYEQAPWHDFCPVTPVEASYLFGGSASHWQLLPNTDNGWKYNINALPTEEVPPIINGSIPAGTKIDYTDGQQVYEDIQGPARISYAEIATVWCIDNILREKIYLPIIIR